MNGLYLSIFHEDQELQKRDPLDGSFNSLH